MPQLLLEIFCEEIPARMQAKAESDLGAALTKTLGDEGLSFGGVETLSGPRRLAVIIEDVAAKSEDVREERKGPKVGAPEKAVEGFMRGAGLTSIDQAEIQSDPKKGDFYVAVIETPGRAATDIISAAIPDIIRGFHWPKSMRWGEGDLRWVRPLQRVVCIFGGKVVSFELEGLASGNQTEGHRVHGRGPFTVTDAASYRAQIEGEGHVMLSRDARRSKIEADAIKVCADAGLELVEDKGLLEEVTGLAEWPVVLLGKMDPAFLDLPEEVIQLSMRTHQKYFAVRDPKTGKLAPNFVVVANIEAKDGGKKIAEGNSRVLSARLNDGRFFWDNDLATPLEEMGAKLATIDFKKELGTIADKVERVAALARELAPKVGADPDLAERAAKLCKADLVSEMVYEFPELQGVMGRYYALRQGISPLRPSDTSPRERVEDDVATAVLHHEGGGGGGAAVGGGLLSGLSELEVTQVADAIEQHYKPQGPSDAVPTDPVSIAVALADKLDTLVGFWAIDEKPTGSKDPFALRRAALGVVRIVLENEVRIKVSDCLMQPISDMISDWDNNYKSVIAISKPRELSEDEHNILVDAPMIGYDCQQIRELSELSELDFDVAKLNFIDVDLKGAVDGPVPYVGNELLFDDVQRSILPPIAYVSDLLSFFADRLKQYLRDQGKRYDLIDAVFALGAPAQDGKGDGPSAGEAAPAEATAVSANDDLVLITKRVDALTAFLATEDGTNLLAGYKRASNILKVEEKKDSTSYQGLVSETLLTEKAEKDLFAALKDGENAAGAALEGEDFEAAMAVLSNMRGPIDAFFDHVTVNTDDVAVRQNRLYLLSQIRSVLGRVADFTKIEG